MDHQGRENADLSPRMIGKTHAVLLRTFPYSESSTVAVWFTEGAGKVTTLIKGAHRPRSHFIGHVDLFYTCEILFYERPTRMMHILKECSPMACRHRLREDWRACAVASYLAYLLYRIAPPRAHQAGLYELLNGALDYLDARGASAAFLFWLELRLLTLIGLAPRLRQCLGCGKSLEPAPRGAVFAIDQGGVRCPACQRDRERHDIPVLPDRLAILSAWQRARTPRLPSRARVSPPQLADVGQAIGQFMEYHLDLALPGRQIALQLLRYAPLTNDP